MPTKLPMMSFVPHPGQKARLRAAAVATGISASEIIRAGIELALRKLEKDGKLPMKVTK